MGKKGSRGFGGSVGINTTVLVLIGSMVGVVADAMWYTLKLPGTATAIAPGCSMLTDADAIQFMGAGGLTLLGFLLDIKFLSSFTFGIMAGMMIPKIITPYAHLPRYILFDYDPQTGNLSRTVNK
jgi:hypothetical protein